jgi:DNA modification methylase
LVPDLTNVTLGRLQLHFIDRSEDEINVINTYNSQAEVVIEDLKLIHDLDNHAYCELFHTDSTNLDVEISKKANIVITSPPYPNRYSYVWNTRPHLYFLDIFDKPKDASSLDLKTIGGTWGVATSNLKKGEIEPIYNELDEILNPIIKKIRDKDNLMANYVMKYFNLLAKQIVEMEKAVTDDVRVAYVVGNSSIKGVYVATDVLLGEIFEALNLGYKTTEVFKV